MKSVLVSFNHPQLAKVFSITLSPYKALERFVWPLSSSDIIDKYSKTYLDSRLVVGSNH
jgi:hypothetical protein